MIPSLKCAYNGVTFIDLVTMLLINQIVRLDTRIKDESFKK